MNQERIREWADDTCNHMAAVAVGSAEHVLIQHAHDLIAEVRREVLEEAAKVCEEEARSNIGYEQAIGSPADWALEANAMKSCATAIRQLAEREGER